MITREEFQKIAISNGYKLKKWLENSTHPDYIDISDNDIANARFLVMRYSKGEVVCWVTHNESEDGTSKNKIGPITDGNVLQTCGNKITIITSVKKCDETLKEFTKNYKFLKKQVRLNKIEEL